MAGHLSGLSDVVLGGLRMRLRRTRVDALLGRASSGPPLQERWMGRSRKRLEPGEIVRDLSHAFRSLLRQPLFTLTAVVTLALGIGANASIFSVVYGFLLRPLPYAEDGRLVMIWSANPARGWQHTDVSLSDAVDWKERTGVFEDLAMANRASFNLTGGDQPERVTGMKVSANLFRVLGTPPAVGRDFEEGEAGPGGPRVAIVSWGLWQRRLGGDPGAIRTEIHLDGEVYTVVGVLSRWRRRRGTSPPCLHRSRRSIRRRTRE